MCRSRVLSGRSVHARIGRKAAAFSFTCLGGLPHCQQRCLTLLFLFLLRRSATKELARSGVERSGRNVLWEACRKKHILRHCEDTSFRGAGPWGPGCT